MDVLIFYAALIVMGAMCLLFWRYEKSSLEQEAKGPWLHQAGGPSSHPRSISDWVITAFQLLFGIWAWTSSARGNMCVLEDVTGNLNGAASMVISAGTLFTVYLLGRSSGYSDCLREKDKGA